MLKHLKLKNFTVFPDLDLTFSPGLNIVVGENGAGKSHLLKLNYVLSSVSAAMGKASRQAKDDWQKRLADKLVTTCRPDYLGRLVSRAPGRNRCEVAVSFVQPKEAGFRFSFATNARSEVKMESLPSACIQSPPVFVPTREMLSIFPGFVAAYEDRQLEFDETYYDLARALSGSAKKKHTAPVQALIQKLEDLMDGHIRQEGGRFYLLPNKAGVGKIEIPLLAEGIRKLGMLAYLLINGALRNRGTLFWDEPETNLNPKLMVVTANALFSLAQQGYQVILATHSLFLLRELEILQTHAKSAVPARYIGLSLNDEDVRVEQANDISSIQTLVLLDEELHQTDRYMALG